jgi:hypothetical protein
MMTVIEKCDDDSVDEDTMSWADAASTSAIVAIVLTTL